MTKKLKPMHPGEVLREEFLVPLNMSAGALAKVCGLPRTRIERIAQRMDFCRTATPRAADCLIVLPPFPPEAHR